MPTLPRMWKTSLSWGPSIKYVRIFSGFLDPLPPPLVRILARLVRLNSHNLPYYVRFWAPSPLPLGTYVLNGCPLVKQRIISTVVHSLNLNVFLRFFFLPLDYCWHDKPCLMTTNCELPNHSVASPPPPNHKRIEKRWSFCQSCCYVLSFRPRSSNPSLKGDRV